MSEKYDLCIKNARVIDTKNFIDEILNIGITKNKISILTKGELCAFDYIQADGCVACAGFIDIHTHEDTIDTEGIGCDLPIQTAQSSLMTGCTTIVTGNCGLSNYPVSEYYNKVKEANIMINCYTCIGNVTLRHLVGLDNYTAAGKEQIEKMKNLASKSLDEGAVGISFGLQYAPGTTFEELLALFSVAAQKDKYVCVHMRYDFPERAVETVSEVVSAAERTNVSLQISHLAANVYGNDNIKKAAEIIKNSKANISADVYPYNVWATSIKSAVFDDGFKNFNFNVEDVEILSGDLSGQFCTEEIFNSLRSSEEDTSVACHNAMPISDVQEAYKLPFVFVASDGQLKRDENGIVKGHPRGSSTPAEFLHKFVREENLMSLNEAINKLTYMPAKKCNFINKGSIASGDDADITIFNFNEIEERANFGENKCAIPPNGIKYVIAGGKIVYATI
nr:amidohydrolase family protein [Sedimentibacter sp.]